MIRKPAHHLADAVADVAVRSGRSVNHDHRQAKRARGQQLGLGPAATGVFGHDMCDVMALQQSLISRHVKGTSGNNHSRIRQRHLRLGRINQPQHIEICGLCGKGDKRLLANRQEHARARVRQRGNSGLYIRHMLPLIARLSHPCWSLKRRQRHTGLGAGRHRIAAHLRSKGMGCVHHMCDALTLYVVDQPSHTTKSALPHGQRLRCRARGSTRIREHRPTPGFRPVLSQLLRQMRGLSCAPQQEYLCHV